MHNLSGGGIPAVRSTGNLSQEGRHPTSHERQTNLFSTSTELKYASAINIIILPFIMNDMQIIKCSSDEGER